MFRRVGSRLDPTYLLSTLIPDTMKPLRYRLLACLIGVAFMPLVQGQSERPFRNPAAWRHLLTEHIEVFYLPGEEAGAGRVARYAELARHEVSQLLDFESTTRYALIYGENPQALLQTNLSLQPEEDVPGVFRLPKRFGIVAHPGNTRDLYREVKQQVARLLLQEFAFHNRLGATLQTDLLLPEMPWFHEGLAEYLAYGWSFEDEMWLASLDGTNYLALALEGEGPLHRRVRKSIWHYIVQEYGVQKLSEIVYLVHVSHSVESGIISVLGINPNTLTQRWREYMLAMTRQHHQGRTRLADLPNGEEVALPAGLTLAGLAYHEGKGAVAAVLYRQGRFWVKIYRKETHTWENTPLAWGSERQDANWYEPQIPLAWSPSGERLVVPIYQRQQYLLAYYEPETGTLEQNRIPNDLRQITAISWSHESGRLVVSAVRNGHADLFVARAGTAAFDALTADAYDDLDPVWSLDDTRVFFTSNRDTTARAVRGNFWASYSRTRDLYELNLSPEATEAPLHRITHTPLVDERFPQAITSYALLYRSDLSGVLNLEEVNVILDEAKHLSDLAEGMITLSATEYTAAFSGPVRGQARLFLAPVAGLRSRIAPEPTLLRLDYENNYRRQVEEPEPVPAPEPLPALEPEETEEAETVPEEPAGPVRYYLFDEEDTPYAVRQPASTPEVEATRPNNDMMNAAYGKYKAPPKLAEVEVDDAGRASQVWRTDYLGFNLQYDPVAGWGPEFSAGFTDLFNNHRVDLRVWPSFNLRNTLSEVRYTRMAGRIDLFAEAGHRSLRIRDTGLFRGDSLNFRYDQLRLDLGARYPLSGKAALELTTGLYRTDRKDLQLLRPQLLDAGESLVRGSAAFLYDNVQYTEGFRHRGLEAEARFESFFSLRDQGFAFHRGRLDLKHYQPVYSGMVLATKLSASLTMPKELRQFYMGGVEQPLVRPIVLQGQEGTVLRPEVTDTTLRAIHFLDFVMPVRGFLPNTRDGSRFVAASLELRLPISRLMRYGLPTKALYNMEIIPFVDAGTVWVDGNPFSQKKPTDTQFLVSGPLSIRLQTLKSPFLIGFGSGIRTHILDWSLRLDLAWGVDDYTLQKPVLYTTVGRNF